jgi:hypothetical protein
MIAKTVLGTVSPYLPIFTAVNPEAMRGLRAVAVQGQPCCCLLSPFYPFEEAANPDVLEGSNPGQLPRLLILMCPRAAFLRTAVVSTGVESS